MSKHTDEMAAFTGAVKDIVKALKTTAETIADSTAKIGREHRTERSKEPYLPAFVVVRARHRQERDSDNYPSGDIGIEYITNDNAEWAGGSSRYARSLSEAMEEAREMAAKCRSPEVHIFCLDTAGRIFAHEKLTFDVPEIPTQ